MRDIKGVKGISTHARALHISETSGLHIAKAGKLRSNKLLALTENHVGVPFKRNKELEKQDIFAE